MVLTRAHARAVLLALAALAAIAALGGCNQSLFDAHGSRDGGGGDGGDDAPVPETCGPDCIADAAADFDGTATGAGGRWRYLNDQRNRQWTAMMPVAGELVGDGGNLFTRCDRVQQVAACAGLADGLLVTSGAVSAPALEYRAKEAKVIRLAVRAYVPAGGPTQVLRLYRNSREDVLATIMTRPGELAVHQITVDALENDRFLLAFDPAQAGASTAVHFFVIDTKRSFPQACQLAVPFTAQGSDVNHADDLCRGELEVFNGDIPMPPFLQNDPFDVPNAAAYFEPNIFYRAGEVIDRRGALTLQFWLQINVSAQEPRPWVFSDLALSGGIAIRLDTTTDPYKLAVVTRDGGMEASQSVPYVPLPIMWHFVRVVHDGTTASICIDGAPAGTVPLGAPEPSTTRPHLGRNANLDTLAYFSGGLDDVRVFSGALPCP